MYCKATDCECQRPQAHRVGRGVPEDARAAAPILRRLCQVKGAHGEPARMEWRDCCKWDLEGAKGPPAAVPVVGSAWRRWAQAAAQGPRGEVIQVRVQVILVEKAEGGAVEVSWADAGSLTDAEELCKREEGEAGSAGLGGGCSLVGEVEEEVGVGPQLGGWWGGNGPESAGHAPVEGG